MPRGQINEIQGSTRFPPANDTMISLSYTRGYGDDDHYERLTHHSRFHSTPKMDFPKFDGIDALIWKHNFELYFQIYGISEMMKVKIAIMNFVDNATLWVKTLQAKHHIVLWYDLFMALDVYWGENKLNVHATVPHH